MLKSKHKTVFYYGTKTNNRLFQWINWLFWFWQQVNHKNSFQPFLKTSKYKTIGFFDKTTGCFSLSLKNTFLLKWVRVLMLWIQSRVDYIWNLPQILSKRQLNNSKHNQPSIILQRVWILQSLNTLGSTITWLNSSYKPCLERIFGNEMIFGESS